MVASTKLVTLSFTSSVELLADPCKQSLISCNERNFSPADELFLSLHADFLPMANENMEGEQTFALGISLTEWGGNCPATSFH